jgi:hypothetical protein
MLSERVSQLTIKLFLNINSFGNSNYSITNCNYGTLKALEISMRILFFDVLTISYKLISKVKT